MCAGCINNIEFAAMNAGLFASGIRVGLQRLEMRLFGRIPFCGPVTDDEIAEFFRRIGAPAPAPTPAPAPAPVPVLTAAD